MANPQELIEIRKYTIFDFEKQQQAEEFLRTALIPALNRMGIDRVGALVSQDDENDHSIHLVIPYKEMAQFVELNTTLAADEEYVAAAAGYSARDLKDPIFQRIESRLTKSFSGMPALVLPPQTVAGEERIFELRLYESHTEHHAALKVDMFNQGEIQIMVDSKMGPVFYGETLIGPRVPNLIYMLSGPNREEHDKHWKTFLGSAEWDRMKKLEKYKDTVSKIDKWYLKPLPFSQI